MVGFLCVWGYCNADFKSTKWRIRDRVMTSVSGSQEEVSVT